MWEVYLPPFEAAVRAGVGTFMASFNEIDGTPAHASHWLLTDVLRDRWKFDGLVVSDWTGVQELLQPRHRRQDHVTAARRALGAGVDMEMSSALYRTTLAAEVRGGPLPDRAHRRGRAARAARPRSRSACSTTRIASASVARETARHPHRRESRGGARDRAASRSCCSPTATSAAHRHCHCARTLRTLAVIGPLADDARSAIGAWSGAGQAGGRGQRARRASAARCRRLASLHVRGAPVDTREHGGLRRGRAGGARCGCGAARRSASAAT